jgi:hypothetical protein
MYVLFPLIYLHEDFNKFTVNDGYCDLSSQNLVVTEIFNNFSNRLHTIPDLHLRQYGHWDRPSAGSETQTLSFPL